MESLIGRLVLIAGAAVYPELNGELGLVCPVAAEAPGQSERVTLL